MTVNLSIKTPKNENKKRVAVGISGGVDSSVSALLLKEQGYEVIGVHMKCWEGGEVGCTSDEDKMYAVQTAAALDIHLEVLDFVKEYKDRVVSYFYQEYKEGRTPNPDVMCNKEIKFGLFFEWAMAAGFDYVATGHYARIAQDGLGFKLLKGVDPSKDQSYFLYILGQSQLSKTLFPIGNYKKTDIRDLAKKYNLPTQTRPDSVGICFIGEVNIKEFLKDTIEPKSGNVMSMAGDIIGSHDGVWFYTIGQRHGFKLTKYFGIPMYVIGKNVEKNELIVGDEASAMKGEFRVGVIHWINKTHSDDFKCDVRIRHLGGMHKAYVKKGDSLEKDLWTVVLEKHIFGVAPGQSAVFYEDAIVLGGGIII